MLLYQFFNFTIKKFMKKFYKYIAIVAIVAAAGFTAYSTQGNKLHLSSLAMENVEALANEETWVEYHLFPCLSSPGNECVMCESDRPRCSSQTYCR